MKSSPILTIKISWKLWSILKYSSQKIPAALFSDDVGIRFCKGFQPGNPALGFHNGYFSVMEQEVNMPKAIALAFKDGKISNLTLCFRFCKSEKLRIIAEQN